MIIGILGFIVVLLTIILFVPLKVKLYFEFVDKTIYKIEFTYLFGIIRKKIDSTDKRVKKTSLTKKEKLKINLIEEAKYFIEKGKITKLYLNLNIGFSDPSILAIIVGLLWSIISLAVGYLTNIKEIKRINLNVTPALGKDVFQLYFLCIIKVNLVYIITAYIRILKENKGGDSIARTPNRRLNENYNE